MEKSQGQASPPESYCVVCDALPARCDHGGARYLSDISYERTPLGWKVPDSERPLWDKMQARTHHVAPVQSTWPLEYIVEELDKRVFVSNKMLAQLTTCYETNPERTTRLGEEIMRAADSGSMKNPAAWLAKLLNEGV